MDSDGGIKEMRKKKNKFFEDIKEGLEDAITHEQDEVFEIKSTFRVRAGDIMKFFKGMNRAGFDVEVILSDNNGHDKSKA